MRTHHNFNSTHPMYGMALVAFVLTWYWHLMAVVLCATSTWSVSDGLRTAQLLHMFKKNWPPNFLALARKVSRIRSAATCAATSRKSGVSV